MILMMMMMLLMMRMMMTEKTSCTGFIKFVNDENSYLKVLMDVYVHL